MKNTLLIIAAAVLLLALSLAAILLLPGRGGKSGADPDGTFAPASSVERDGVRGVWVATVGNIDFPSEPGLSADELKTELDGIVSTVSSAGLNRIFFQVRPSSDAFYESEIFPASAYISGVQGEGTDFDILDYLIKKAADENIKIFAWINPLRVTASTSLYGDDGLPVFAESNPASARWELLFKYDSLYYYDPGYPEVRELIAAGVSEVVSAYDVAGVVFDDYFYPYPKEGCTVDDADTFAAYGAGFGDIDDWRRDNVNRLVESCYKAVKEADENCLFGISPFGIWKNNDGSNGGSDTAGLQAYDEIYCDATAWIDGGYIDFICPQIYWNIGYPAADYKTLVDWWNAALEGHDEISLLIGHGLYKISEWENENELTDQIGYAASKRNYGGSVFYGYKQIRTDDRGCAEALSGLYKK